MRRKPRGLPEGKKCTWPARRNASAACGKTAHCYMVSPGHPGHWCCGIHANSAWNQGWTEGPDPTEVEEPEEDD